MNKNWFKKLGWIYYPTAWQGVVFTLLPLIFMIHIFLVFNRMTHSISDLLYNLYPFWVPTFLLWLWIASKTSTGFTHVENK